MQINPISAFNQNKVFKSNNHDDKYRRYLEKSNYIEKKLKH